ncbi:MAG: D-alanyl-D-alanine carboxypeptidase/D-alanyl-D-alanine-endopeptidase [Burkholderiales bacterium]|nr:D-alanyl-D-alanine carboxypeptidase/D-alanyl-D-alanine-endopeptidase [Burkholderiales bacterium]
MRSKFLLAPLLCAVCALGLIGAPQSQAHGKQARHHPPHAPARRTGLPPQLAGLLAASRLPATHVSLYVARVANPDKTRRAPPRPLLSLNADLPRNSASTMKLITTAASLDLLGPDYRWRTATYTDGVIENRVLHGNLYVRGTGDPKLVPEEMVKLVADIRDAGIDRIDGDLVLDRSYYGSGIRDGGPIDDEVDRPYNVSPDPLLYSFKALSFTFNADTAQGVDISVLPPLSPLTIDNGLTAVGGPCGDWLGRIHPRLETDASGALVAHFSGGYPVSCGTQQWNVAAPDANQFFLDGFRALWAAAGGQLDGGVRDGVVPPGARLVASYRGQTLAQAIYDMNKFSNNVMARQIFLTLGAREEKPPATLDKARAAVRDWLAQAHLSMPGLVLDNGSGLSRYARITAADMGRLLQYAINRPTGQQFMQSLPLVGVDGTMRNRLRGDGVSGNAYVKTGTLDDVRAIAGYVGTAAGSSYVVVGIINDPQARDGIALLNGLLDWVYHHAP